VLKFWETYHKEAEERQLIQKKLEEDEKAKKLKEEQNRLKQI